jgi:hypothetical protein
MKMKYKEALIDLIQSAVAEYCYLYTDDNFEITVKITARDGFVTALPLTEEQQ